MKIMEKNKNSETELNCKWFLYGYNFYKTNKKGKSQTLELYRGCCIWFIFI